MTRSETRSGPAPLSSLGLSAGKLARLHRILYRHGVGNGSAIFLPYDQGLEHGPRDFFTNPDASDPGYIVKLAVEGGFNGVALQIGSAEKFFWEYAGEVPLILKLNGKTEIAPADQPLSPLNATVEDAVRLGADAVGYTLYVGSPSEREDFDHFRRVREDAQRLGMPVIVWAYPRGSAVDAKGGKDSFYAIDYAARTAAELGADVVKVNFPDPSKREGVKPDYDRDFSAQEAVDAVVRSACRALVLLSGGEKAGDQDMLEKSRQSLDAGATGLIFGRNVWQRPHDESLRFVNELKDLLAKYPRTG
jgi:class I fructose-bisphosphate aldolase